MKAIHIQMFLVGFLEILRNDYTVATSVRPLNGYRPYSPVTIRSRLGRAAFDQDSPSHDHKPELTARHERNYTLLNCTIRKPRLNSDVYVSCPALGSTMATGPCYQGCQPTKVCGKSGGGLSESCVPNEQTVFCQKTHSSNGTLIILLRINRADPRLTGTWSCNHAGLESAKFEIGLEKTVSATEEKSSELVKLPEPGKKDIPVKDVRVQVADDDDYRALAYMRKPEVIFAVLTVLGVSLFINMLFCIRCLMMRLYLDAYDEGSKSANCLGACLCIPKGQRKSPSVRMTPLLPRSATWGHVTNPSNYYQSSAHSFYPSPNLTKMPLLISQQSANDLNGMAFCHTNSLPGTLRKYGPSTSSIGQLDMMFNQSFAHPSTVDAGAIYSHQTCFPGAGDLGMISNYMPSYVRAQSVNMPSPDQGHRILPVNNSVCATSLVPSNTFTQNAPQYLMRMQPTIIGGQVVYDDVAAGTSSIVGNYNYTPNGSAMENSPAPYQQPHLRQNQASNVMLIQEPAAYASSQMAMQSGNGGPYAPCSSAGVQPVESQKHATQSPQPTPRANAHALNSTQNITGTNSNTKQSLPPSNVQHIVAQFKQTTADQSNALPVNGLT